MRTSSKCTPTLGVSAVFFALVCALSLLSGIAQAAPTISGTPRTAVTVSTYYSWAPTARDPAVEQRTLRYSIVNKPSWAVFSVYSGKLEGSVPATPATWGNIRISVRSATGTATLPAFSITSSRSGSTGGGTTNRPPVLSGTAPTSVTAGNAYAFRPTGSDPEGRALTWSITNRPAWATFSTTSGALTGTPTAAQVGTTSGIVIRASDGTNTASLPSFNIAVNAAGSSTGSATLSWTPPTTNTNGSSVSLAGYRIYYGTSASNLSRTVQVANAGLTRYVLSDLSAGTWYFAVRAYSSNGSESANSNTGSKTVR
jgi:hypothetical protein